MGKIRLIGMAMVLVFLSTSCVGKIRDLEDELSRAELEYVELEKDYADLLKVNQKLGEGDGSLVVPEFGVDEALRDENDGDSGFAREIGGGSEGQAGNDGPRLFEEVAIYYEEPMPNVFEYGYIGNDYAANHMTDMSLIFLDILGVDGYEGQTFITDEIVSKIHNNNQDKKTYIGGVEKDSDEIYLFYSDNYQSFADIYRLEIGNEGNENWIYVKSLTLGFEILEVEKTINTILFKVPGEGNHWIVCDRDLVVIEELVLPENMIVSQMRYYDYFGELRYFWEVLVDGVTKYYSFAPDYSHYVSNHCIGIINSPMFLNGLELEDVGSRVLEIVKVKILHMGKVFDISNSGFVTRLKVLKRDIPELKARLYDVRQVKNLFVFRSLFFSAKDDSSFYMEKGDEFIAPEHPIFQASIKDLAFSFDRDYYYYVEEESLDLVRVDQYLYEVTRFCFDQDQYINTFGKTNLWNLEWGFVDQRLVWIEGESVFWIDLDTGLMSSVETGIFGWNIEKNGLYSNYMRKQKFSFETETTEFVYEFTRALTIQDLGYYVFEGITYYADDSQLTLGPTEALYERGDIKPVSEAPQIFYGEQEVFISGTAEAEGSSYVQISYDRWIGRVEGNQFIPLSKKPVRSVSYSGERVIYTGYDDMAGSVFYYDGQAEYMIKTDKAVDSVTIMGEEVFYVTEGKNLASISLEALKSGNTQGDVKLDLKGIGSNKIYGQLPLPDFKLETDGEFLIAYDWQNILVFDQELHLLDSSKGRFLGLTKEHQMIVDLEHYIFRRDLKEQRDHILRVSSGSFLGLIVEDKMIGNFFVYDPGETDIIYLYEDLGDNDSMVTINDSGGQGFDYSIELGRSQDTMILVYDHIRQRLEIVAYTNARDYELREDGFYYWDNYEGKEHFYPLRPNSKVRIYEEDRL